MAFDEGNPEEWDEMILDDEYLQELTGLTQEELDQMTPEELEALEDEFNDELMEGDDGLDVGPEPADMSQIKSEKAKKVDGSKCSICVEQLKVGDEIVRLKCKHHFHKACIVPWFKNNNTCPNCRQEAT